jgi:hypothetical protein
MKPLLLIVLTMIYANYGFAGDHQKNKQPKNTDAISRHFLLDAQDCKETKEGIGVFLSKADYIFDDIRAYGEEKSKKWNDKKWLEASFLSELAANYSTIYQVWCKRRPHQ